MKQFSITTFQNLLFNYNRNRILKLFNSINFCIAGQLDNWAVAHLKDEIKIEGWEGDPMDKCITYIDDIEFDMNSNKVNTAFETDCSGTDVVTICKKKIGKFKLTFF